MIALNRIDPSSILTVRVRRWSLMLSGLASLCLLAGCMGAQEKERIEPRTLTPVSQIAEAPAAFFDRGVTVRGMVGFVWSPSAFTIVGSTPGAEVLILTRTPIPATFAVKKGQIVQARGTVRPLNKDEFEAGYGLRFAQEPQGFGVLDNWIGKPVVVCGPIKKVYFEPADTWTSFARPGTRTDAF